MRSTRRFIKSLLEDFPHLTEKSAERIVGYVLEQWLAVLRVGELPPELYHSFMMKCVGVVELSGYMQFESYSENGLSAVIDKNFVTRGLVPRVKVVSAGETGVG